MSQVEPYFFEHEGFCAICDASTTFTASSAYFRNSLRCRKCKTAPRHRAVWEILNKFCPKWQSLSIHECSPGLDAVSISLANKCANYTATQFDPNIVLGSLVDSMGTPWRQYQVENLEKQTFPDSKFDIVVLQDVFEHLFRPDLAIKEIARTLRDGGAVILTVPIVRKEKPSLRRASLETDGTIQFAAPPQYHGNPVGDGRSLVTFDWGYDIVSFLQFHSQMPFLMIQIDDIDRGIRADLIEVLIGFKRPLVTDI